MNQIKIKKKFFKSKFGDKNGTTKNNKKNKNINSYNEDVKEKNDDATHENNNIKDIKLSN